MDNCSIEKVLVAAREAARQLNLLDENKKKEVLNAVADQTEADAGYILSENARDLPAMGKSNPK